MIHGLWDKIFGSEDSGGEKRKAKDGVVFEEATKGQVIIRRPGQKPAIGHPPDHPGYTKNKKK